MLGHRVPALLISPWVPKRTLVNKPQNGPQPTSEVRTAFLSALCLWFRLTQDACCGKRFNRPALWSGSTVAVSFLCAMSTFTVCVCVPSFRSLGAIIFYSVFGSLKDPDSNSSLTFQYWLRFGVSLASLPSIDSVPSISACASQNALLESLRTCRHFFHCHCTVHQAEPIDLNHSR